jgi:hypothetical protein
MGWKKLLESAKESLNDHLRLRNEYLMAENRILRNQINGRVQLTDSERKELAEIGAKLGKKAPPVQVVPLLCNKFKLDVSFPKPLFIFLVLF